MKHEPKFNCMFNLAARNAFSFQLKKYFQKDHDMEIHANIAKIYSLSSHFDKGAIFSLRLFAPLDISHKLPSLGTISQ